MSCAEMAIDKLSRIVSGIMRSMGIRPRGIYYINGPDVLPPPLTREEEAEMIAIMDTDENAK